MKHFKYLVLLLGIPSIVSAYIPTNFYRPHEVDFQAYDQLEEKHPFRIGAFAEYGTTDDARNWDENLSNALQIYNPYESSIAMFLGAPEGSTVDKMGKALGISAATATEDTSRGKFCVTGEYEELSTVVFAKYRLPIKLDGTFELAIYAPFKKVEWSDVCWADQTKNVLAEDKEFKEDVSSQLCQKAKELGCLDINANGYSKTGMGDLVVMLNWNKGFKQDKEYLKKVYIHAGVGASIPTGEKKDHDQSLSVPFGYDGAWGIPANLGLDLDFINNIRAGVDLSFLGIFDTSGSYRMKTSRHQTDFLLLQKGDATLSQGPTWKFTLYGKAKKIIGGLSAMISYHFLKHDENRLSPKSYCFDYEIVNTAQSLKEWNSQSFVIEAAYDFFPNSKFNPRISGFYKFPVLGKRVLLAETFGGQIGITF